MSLLYVLENGVSAEIAIVGNEGILGSSSFMGGETTPSRAVVQSAGHGYRLRAAILKEEFSRAGPLLRLLLRYTQALITQMSQTAVCNRHHTVEQQLCRWLLLSIDRLSSNSLRMTQELIANMLGVRREGVTEAAGNLQRGGLIRYTRGRIEVLDRSGLEQAVCECYGVVKLEFDRLLSDIPRGDPFHVLGRSHGQLSRTGSCAAGSGGTGYHGHCFPNSPAVFTVAVTVIAAVAAVAAATGAGLVAPSVLGRNLASFELLAVAVVAALLAWGLTASRRRRERKRVLGMRDSALW